MGTLVLLEAATRVGVRAFVMTSTTSAFGDALKPPPGAPAAWIDESVAPVPKNIYGVTKTAAEDLCQLFHRNEGLASIVLRTSRFFPEEDDDPEARAAYADDNAKANEYLFRRVAIEDVVDAHLAAAERAPAVGFGRYIISATTPFLREDCARLRADAPAIVKPARPGVGVRICAARLAHVPEHRPRLRQFAGAPRPRLAAEMGFRRDRRSACARPATFAGRWRERSARRATTPSGSKARPIRWREAEVSEFAVWTRLDRPGRDAALLQAHAGGWLLRGAAAFEHELGSAVVAYEVQVDARLETTRGALSGFLGEASVRHEILRDESGWRLNGAGSMDWSIWSISTTASPRRPTSCSSCEWRFPSAGRPSFRSRGSIWTARR